MKAPSELDREYAAYRRNLNIIMTVVVIEVMLYASGMGFSLYHLIKHAK